VAAAHTTLPVLGVPVLHFAGTAPLHDALQFWLSIGLGALALRDWGRMASTLPVPGPGAAAAWEVVPAPPEASRQVVASLVGAALAGAALAPQLWADPLGPFVKIFPAMALALAVAALAEER
jgi:hypothetical protein